MNILNKNKKINFRFNIKSRKMEVAGKIWCSMGIIERALDFDFYI
jgi:hypothetical protein